MKKLKLTLAGVFCAISLQAGVNLGITQTTLGDGDPGYGMDLGTHWLYSPEKFNGAGVGFGTDMLFFSLGKVKGLNDDAGMLVNLNLLGGYSFARHGLPVTLIGGVGYGVGQIGSDYFDGFTYQGAVEYDFSETKGIGFKYTHNSADLIFAETKNDLDSFVFYFKFSRKK